MEHRSVRDIKISRGRMNAVTVNQVSAMAPHTAVVCLFQTFLLE